MGGEEGEQGYTQKDMRRLVGVRVKEDLSPSCESVPDPELNDSILDPDMSRTCVSVCIYITLRNSHYD